ncbi:keratin, type I cytoskeletal 47 kDa-like [Bufo gargarizans]|uniref:keratin, type I cytoskeletal 47 kDa-like n=1 Tax=Bufo gargarizans TaxID=30331 RepID=UPI001CF3BE99|nr:keratin, type I cytoskeletal 47 kDa-like [Bufo gargarizans]
MANQYKRNGGVSYGSSSSNYSFNASSSSFRQCGSGRGGGLGFGGVQGITCLPDGYGSDSGGNFSGAGSGGSFGGGTGVVFGGNSGGAFGSGFRFGFGGGSGGAFSSGSVGAFGYGGGSFGGGVGSGGFGGNDGLLSGNEKQTMQNLNDRLATYLDKVHALEEANADLEAKIKNWYDQNSSSSTTTGGKDYSQYLKTIEDLQTQVLCSVNDNASIILAIDNARLAVDDFRMKFESELHLRQSVEADINGLRKVLDDLTLSQSDFEMQAESLTEEIAFLKKNHEDEVQSNQGTTVGQVNVEMDAAPGKDLTKILNGMRSQYEALAEKNRKDAEDLFNQQSSQITQQINVGVQQQQSNKTEMTELRRTLQSLEMELQAQYAMKQSLEESLAEKEGSYCSQISQIQMIISGVEDQLEQIKNDTACQKSEYETLLDIKVRLEQEIATYQKLLDEGDSEVGQVTTQQGSRTTTTSQASRAGGTSVQSSRASTTQSSRSATSTSQTSGAGSVVSGSGGLGASATSGSRLSSGLRSSIQTSSITASSATKSQSGSGSAGSAGQSSSASATSGTAGARSGGSSSSVGSGNQSSDAKTRRTIVKTETYIDGNIVDSKTEEIEEPVK